MIVRILLGLGLVATVATTAPAATATLQDRQAAACYDDVQRLCGTFIPDVAKTEACMATMKTKVSEGCRRFYTE